MFNIYTFLTYAFTASYTPGPNNIMSMSNASRYGFRKSFPFNLGVFCGFSLLIILCALFSAALFQFIPTIKRYITFVGAAYMLWLAWKTWKRPPRIEIKESNRVGFVSGVFMQFVNPKAIIYGITSTSTYILPHFKEPSAVLGFAVLLAFISFTSTICWSAFGSVFSVLFSKHAVIVNAVMALLLVYCAVSLFL